MIGSVVKRWACALLSAFLLVASVPLAAIAEEGLEGFEQPEPEYDRGTGAQAESWRYTNGIPDSLVLECTEEMPGISEEGLEGFEQPEPEYDRGTGAQAESWRYTNGIPDSLVLECTEEMPGISLFGAYDDLTGTQVQKARDTWTKANGPKTYTYRKNPTDDDTIIQVPGSYTVGIDVSEHNNAPGGKPSGSIDWQQVKADGISFAIIRCGYGSDFASQDDKWFADNFRGAKAAGLKVGVYLYSYATKVQGSNSAAESEAAHVLRILRQNNIRPSDLDLPVYLDLEDEIQERLSSALLGQIAKTFCSTVQNSGYKVGIYANQHWYKSILVDPVFRVQNMRSSNWSRWVARYSWGDSDPGVEATDIWQFTDIGKVNGTPKKYCDVNFIRSSNWSRWVARYSWGDSDPGVEATDIWQFTDIGKVNGTPKKYCDVNFILSSSLASALSNGPVESNGTWVQKSGKWYLRDPWGSNLTGWQLVKGTWYYMNSSGVLSNGPVESNGTWVQKSGKWYLRDPWGSNLTGWQLVKGTWYYMNSSGVMLTGWQKVNGKWYYLGSSGAMRIGWQKIGGSWYLLGSSGAMATGWQKVGSTWYHLKPSGAMTTGWLRQGSTWYYLDGSGAMATGWREIGGLRYWFNESGHMGAMTTGWLRQGSTWYYLDGSGAMATGWREIGGLRYWFNESGHMAIGWLELNGNTFFLESNGAMVCDTVKVIDGKSYEFDRDGVLVSCNEAE